MTKPGGHRSMVDGQDDGGGGGGGGTVDGIVPGLNILVDSTTPSEPVVSTVPTGFLQFVISGDDVGPQRVFRKAGLNESAPGIVQPTNYLGTDTYEGFDGVTYTQGALVGVHVDETGETPIGPGSIPASWFVYMGSSSDPWGDGDHLPLQVFANGAVASGFPAGSSINFLTHDTANFNAFNAVGDLRNNFAGWLLNGAGEPTAMYIDHANISVTTAGAECGGFVQEVAANGLYVIASSVQGLASGATQLINGSAGVVGSPSYTWSNDLSEGLYLVIGLGPDFDIGVSIHGVQGYLFEETGTVGNLSHYVRANASGTGQGGFLVAPGLLTGLLYDPVSGGAYCDAVHSSFAIGAPGFTARADNSGFLALPTRHGSPTSAPANMVAGKTAASWDDTNVGLWAGVGGTFAFVPTATAVANGTVNTALGAFAPAGSSATPTRWLRMPDGQGGIFTVASVT
jgi:hypothetical protein